MKEQVLDFIQRVAVALVIESLKELYKRHLQASRKNVSPKHLK